MAMLISKKPFLTQEALLTLFHSLILSHIRYCITTWCYGHSVLLNKLQKICNKFINMIISTNPTKKRNKEITKDNILNIQQLYKLNISIFMYKSFHKQLPSAFNNIFQRKTSTVITRSNFQIIPISCKNTVTKQSIRYIGPKIWNELPEKIKLCKYLSTLLKNLKHSSLNNNQTYKLLRRSLFNIFCWSSFSCVSGKQLHNLKIFNSTTARKDSRKVLRITLVST